MKTIKTIKTIAISISISCLLPGCSTTTTSATAPVSTSSYTGVYVAPVAHVNRVSPVVFETVRSEVPRLDYVGFDANWYGGTPDYFNTTIVNN